MARKVDLTEKLGGGERPRIAIGDVELEVDDSARTMMRVLGATRSDMTPETVMEVIGLLFGEGGSAALDGMDLTLPQLVTVLEAAVDLVLGGGEDAGNPVTPATT